MKSATISTVLPCTPEALWAVLLDPSYLHSLYLEELGYQALVVLEISETAYKIRVTPRMRLPAPVARLVGDSFTYEEHGSLDRASNVCEWRMVQPSNLDSRRRPRSEAVSMRGTVRVEHAGDRHCVRTDAFSVEARLFGLGSLIESSIEWEIQNARAKEHAFLARRVGT